MLLFMELYIALLRLPTEPEEVSHENLQTENLHSNGDVTISEKLNFKEKLEIDDHKKNSADQYGNETDDDKFGRLLAEDTAAKNVSSANKAYFDSSVSSAGSGEIKTDGNKDNGNKPKCSDMINEQTSKETSESDGKHQKNDKSTTGEENGLLIKAESQADGETVSDRKNDRISDIENKTSVISDNVPHESRQTHNGSNVDGDDIVKKSSPKETISDDDRQDNRKHSEEFMFKYINDTTGSRPSSKSSRASPPKLGDSQHRQVKTNPSADVCNEAETGKDEKHSRESTDQHDTRMLQSSSKSSEIVGSAKQQEKVVKQRSLEETSRTRKASTPKSKVKTKEKTENKIEDEVIKTKKEQSGRPKRIRISDPDTKATRKGEVNKPESEDGLRKGDLSSSVKTRKLKSADNVLTRPNIPKDHRRKSDISPYVTPNAVGPQTKKTSATSQKSQTKKKSNDSVISQILSSGKSTPSRSGYKIAKSGSRRSSRKISSSPKDEQKGGNDDVNTSPLKNEAAKTVSLTHKKSVTDDRKVESRNGE
ncbi:micronuclear linker histone polyprotein-like [Argopecten irradians]|uniref:micronuclear linker histone polyprotein-like n=1 Tax=Argopecten irradians TaxID=31199 RepID=UPI0037150E26